jgi:hypothetical protein
MKFRKSLPQTAKYQWLKATWVGFWRILFIEKKEKRFLFKKNPDENKNT